MQHASNRDDGGMRLGKTLVGRHTSDTNKHYLDSIILRKKNFHFDKSRKKNSFEGTHIRPWILFLMNKKNPSFIVSNFFKFFVSRPKKFSIYVLLLLLFDRIGYFVLKNVWKEIVSFFKLKLHFWFSISTHAKFQLLFMDLIK